MKWKDYYKKINIMNLKHKEIKKLKKEDQNYNN